MYERIEKPKENESRAVANSVAHKKSDVEQGFGFVDNRPETRALQEITDHSIGVQRKVFQLKKTGIKAVTTGLFEESHIAKSIEDAQKQGRAREAGQRYLHFMKRDYLQNVDKDFEKQFANELKADAWVAPVADVVPNNYWTTGKYKVWEYDRNTDKVSVQMYRLCLGLFFTPMPSIDKIEIGIHHIQSVQ